MDRARTCLLSWATLMQVFLSVCILLQSTPAHADLVTDLYTHRLLFAQEGDPLVAVGLAHSAKRVVLQIPVDMRIEADGLLLQDLPLALDDVAQDLHISAADVRELIVEIDWLRGAPAVVEETTIVETLEGPDRALQQEKREMWRGRGVQVDAISVGGVYGMRGTVVDNRAVLLTTSQKLPADSFEKYGVRPAAWSQLREQPVMEIAYRFIVKMSVPIQNHKTSSKTSSKTSNKTSSKNKSANSKKNKKDKEGKDKKVKNAKNEQENTENTENTAKEEYKTIEKVVLSGKTHFLRMIGREDQSITVQQPSASGRLYRREIAVIPDTKGTMAIVNMVSEDSLIAGILPSEMFASAPIEALKAQAVTARGELFAKIGRRHMTDPYLICTEQHCQVYKGMSAEHPRTRQAALETAGELAFLEGNLVDSVYSACCGGHTEPADIVWDRPPQSALSGVVDAPASIAARRAQQNRQGSPIKSIVDVDHSLLWPKHHRHGVAAEDDMWIHASTSQNAVSVASDGISAKEAEQGAALARLDLSREEDVRKFLKMPREMTFCGRSSFNQQGDAYRWERRFSSERLREIFRDMNVGAVQHLVVEERGPGGRLRTLRVEGEQGIARLYRELPVRRKLDNLRSGLFVIDEERDEDGGLQAITLRGAGFGHGSGMCQQGAIGMAEAGYTYRDILRHYYNGAEVKKVF